MNTESEEIFQLEGAGRAYDGHRALHPLDLTIARGERLALIGPSGCGKSTFIRMLAGLVAPSEGRVLFRGEDLAAADLLKARRSMGYVIQDGGLFPHMTARENVILMARELGWAQARIDERIVRLAELVHMSDERLAKYPAELSGGQRQRVSLMRALMLEPEVLLFDEPLGALDPMIRFRLQEDLAAIFGEVGATVVLVTHDLAEAAYLAERIVLLREGSLEQEGRFRDLLEAPASDFVTEFVQAQRGLSQEAEAK
mgnify:CR=1 FL=1